MTGHETVEAGHPPGHYPRSGVPVLGPPHDYGYKDLQNVGTQKCDSAALTIINRLSMDYLLSPVST